MDQESLSSINRYLLLSVAGLLAVIIFLIDYFGYGWAFTTTTMVGIGFCFTLYIAGRQSENKYIRRATNLVNCCVLAVVIGFIDFILTKTSPSGWDWVFGGVMITVPLCFLAFSIRDTIRYWSESPVNTSPF